MDEKGKKVLGEERRNLILGWLKENGMPIKGSELARRTNVSRQVIVQDISLLKARDEPIIATSQGYMYIPSSPNVTQVRRVIACQHRPEDTQKELQLIVDAGVTVEDVTIEHAVYGDLRGSLMLSNRRDVEHFMTKLNQTASSLLSELTDGVHLHTLTATTEQQLDDACQSLEHAGFLLQHP